jgi:hypothetical protein
MGVVVGPRFVHTPLEFTQVVGVILQKYAREQNPDKTPMAGGRHEG